MSNPFELLTIWLNEEEASGAPNPKHVVLSTTGLNNEAHGRVVAIREFSEEGFLFFTQKETRKVAELSHNPKACMTFWFELHQRQIIIEGRVNALTAEENKVYWRSYPRDAQIRFNSYAPTSGRPIKEKQLLEEKRQQLALFYSEQEIPVSPYYCGFLLEPLRFLFYDYQVIELSDVFEFSKVQNSWRKQLISP